MTTVGQSIRVNQHTTVDQLQHFAGTVGDKSRLRGKQMDDGSILLYTKTGSSSMMSRLSGKAAERRETARDAIKLVLQNQDSHAGKVGLKDNNALRVGLGCLYAAHGMNGDHAMRGTEFKTIASTMGQVQKLVNSKDQTVHLGDGKRLTDLDKGGVDQLVSTIAKLVTSEADLDGLADAMAKGLAVLVKSGLNEEEKLKFALSPGVGFKEDLKEQLLEELGKTADPNWTGTIGSSEKMSSFLDKAYNKIASDLLPNKMQGDGSIQVGNDVYTKTKHIASGGFGSVALYECGNKKVAVKTSLTKEPDKMAEFSKEYFAHRTAVGGDSKIGTAPTNPNLVGLHGAFRAENGDIGVIMEYVPNKSLQETMENIQSALQRGDITKRQALDIAMTAVKDVAQGLGQMEKAKTDPTAEGGKTVHGDLKPPNVFVQTGGIAKIGDFGTAQGGGEYKLTSSPQVDNPRWLAPEIIILKEKKTSLRKDDTHLSDTAKSSLTDIKKDLEVAFKNQDVPEPDLKKLYSAITDAQRKEAIAELSTTRESDVWALGVIAFNLAFGRNPADSTFMSDIESQLKEFAQNPFNQAVTTVTPGGQVNLGAFAAYSSGDLAVDGLINTMLSPSMTDRPTPDQVLNHPALNTAGVGSQATRTLFDVIQSGDQARIRQLSGVNNTVG
jgi:serine/threonine protein kinase